MGDGGDTCASIPPLPFLNIGSGSDEDGFIEDAGNPAPFIFDLDLVQI